jgi:hypothetical protein
MLGFTRQFIGMPFAFINIERLCAEVISEADTGNVMPMQSPADVLFPWEDLPGSKALAKTFEREISQHEKSIE